MPSDATTAPVCCSEIADDLATVDDFTLMVGATRDHVQQCLRCQAEVAHYRRLRRAMRSLAQDPFVVRPDLEHEILVLLDDEDGRQTHRVPAVAAATLGGLAAAAGVIALAARHRRLAS